MNTTGKLDKRIYNEEVIWITSGGIKILLFFFIKLRVRFDV